MREKQNIWPWIFGVALLGIGVAAAERWIAFEGIKSIGNGVIEQSNNVQEKILEQTRKIQHDQWAAQKVKVFIRAKGAKQCMKELNIDVINNEVIECNKDHYVEMRNDEAEAYKIANK